MKITITKRNGKVEIFDKGPDFYGPLERSVKIEDGFVIVTQTNRGRTMFPVTDIEKIESEPL